MADEQDKKASQKRGQESRPKRAPRRRPAKKAAKKATRKTADKTAAKAPEKRGGAAESGAEEPDLVADRDPGELPLRAGGAAQGTPGRRPGTRPAHRKGPRPAAVLARGAAQDIRKLIDSAAANAENNHDLIADEMRVAEITVDEGPTLKRFRPRALGRATPIHKRTSHIAVALSPERD